MIPKRERWSWPRHRPEGGLATQVSSVAASPGRTRPRSQAGRHRLARAVAAVAVILLLARPGVPGLAGARPAEPPAGDIVGGTVAAPGAWPWQVAIIDPDAPNTYLGQYCGGSLIDPEWVVTAAHCVTDEQRQPLRSQALRVGLGIHDLEDPGDQIVTVSQVIVHPVYATPDDPRPGDIALLRLSEPARLGPRVRTVDLVASTADPAIQAGRRATITGWGMVDDGSFPSLLHQAEVPIVETARCDTDASELCAGDLGHDTCYGDSGGPLVVGSGSGAWRLAGLTSAGTTGVCGGPDNYTTYTSIPHYGDWIRERLAAREPALEIEKSAPEFVAREGTIGYTIVLRNVGRAPASGVVVVETLPEGTRFVAAEQGGQLSGQTIVWRLPSIAAGASFGFNFRVQDLPGAPSASQAPSSAPALSWAPHRRIGRGSLGGWRPAGQRAGPAGGTVDIVGGRKATLGAWPWQAALVYPEEPDPVDAQFCGGVLIDPRWVLTAAHCVMSPFGMAGPGDIEVRLGIVRLTDGGGQRIGISKVIPNLRYLFNDEVDLALLELAQPARLDSTVRPVAFARSGDAWLFEAGRLGTVTGWGATDPTGSQFPDDLYQLEMPIADQDTCSAVADVGLTLCAGVPAGDRSACYGDSGGPFVVKRPDGSHLLAGIVSRGSGRGCGGPGQLSLFAKPSTLAAWIEDKMATGLQDELLVNHSYGATAEGGLGTDGAPAFTVVAAASSELGNLSTRAPTLSGDQVLIGGFIITGGPLTVALRAAGPDLARRGVAGAMENPVLRLYSGTNIIAENDDWQSAESAELLRTRGMAPADPRESALVLRLQPGAYTAIVQGAGGGQGIGLVEIFRLSGSGSLTNLSTRAPVLNGDGVMIGGFIVQNKPAKLLIRAIGPDLANRGVPGALQDPTLQLYSGQTVIAENDNWGSGAQAQAIIDTRLAPQSPRESALLTTLPPGAYTAIVRGAGGGTGIGLVEVFRIREQREWVEPYPGPGEGAGP